MNGPNDGYKNGYSGGNFRPGQDLHDYHQGREAASRAAENLERFRRSMETTNPIVHATSRSTRPVTQRSSIESPEWLIRLATVLGLLAAARVAVFVLQQQTGAASLVILTLAACIAYAVVKYGILLLYEFARIAVKALAVLIPLAFFIQWLTGHPVGTLLIDCLKAVYHWFIPL